MCKVEVGYAAEPYDCLQSVGDDFNREDCCLPCTINKDKNSIYSCVSFDVMFMLMTHGWFN